jgi:Fuc2NAc and GlcNAc transferase
MTAILPSLFLSVAGVLLVQHLAIPLGLLDAPNQRSSHRLPTPRGGGLGLLAAMIFLGLSGYLPPTLWLPAALVAGSGFYDDCRNLNPFPKLLCQLGAGVILLAGLPVSGFSLSVLLWLGFALLFLLGTTNIYNFMDGINGLAAVTGIIAFAGLACFDLLTGADPSLVTAHFAMLAACAGFLPFNLPRARIFMGDTGSLLLGFLLGGQILQFPLPLLRRWTHNPADPLARRRTPDPGSPPPSLSGAV